MIETIIVKVNNWDKHQPNRKDVLYPTWFKMSNRLMDDPKVLSMSDQTFRVLLYIFCQCSQNNSSTITLVPSMFRLSCTQVGVKRGLSIISTLEQLQILSIVSRNVRVTPSIDKIRIDKIKNRRRRVDHTSAHVTCDGSPKLKNKPNKLSESGFLWDAYYDEYLNTHNKEPAPRNAKVNSQLCNLVRWFGNDKAEMVVRYYFKLPNAYYHKTFHSIGVLIKDAHAIYGSMTTGKVITSGQARQIERTHETLSQMERIEKGEI